jgi:hypothetical protein
MLTRTRREDGAIDDHGGVQAERDGVVFAVIRVCGESEGVGCRGAEVCEVGESPNVRGVDEESYRRVDASKAACRRRSNSAWQ